MVYAHAPIIEAVIDIQVALPNVPPVSEFERLASNLKAQYPLQADANQISFNFSVNASGAPTTHAQNIGNGKRLTNESNNRVLLLQSRGLTFSHLAPYTEWSTFRAEALENWKKYFEIVRATSVTRLALRYINRIYLPPGPFMLSDFFRVRPESPDDLPLSISQMLMQIHIPQVDMGSGVVAIVNLASAGVREDGAIGFMLDIDLAATEDVIANDEVIFSRLDELRVRKNKLFEAFITENTRELFR